MGICNSKKEYLKNSITIPDNFTRIKLVSITLDIKNSINLKKNILSLSNYFFNNKIDILCIERINDSISLFNLIKHFKKEAIERNTEIFICPEFENINYEINTTITLPFSNNTTKQNDMYVPNILISKYKVCNYSKLFLNKNNNSFVLSSNIIINNSIMTLFVCSLSKDMSLLNISNKDKRKKEMIKIRNRIINNTTIIENECTNYKKTDINIIIGDIPIDEFNNNQISEEYKQMIETFRGIDLYRYLNENEIEFTDIMNKRNNYILFFLTNSVIYTDNNITNISSAKEMIELLFDKYTFYTVKYSIDKKYNIFNSYPVCLDFIINTT